MSESKRITWLKGLQVGDTVKVRDFWEGEYKVSISQTTDRFIWCRFETKEVVRFSRKTGRQAKGGMELQMPDVKKRAYHLTRMVRPD